MLYEVFVIFLELLQLSLFIGPASLSELKDIRNYSDKLSNVTQL